jgi:hypothetical protein
MHREKEVTMHKHLLWNISIFVVVLLSMSITSFSGVEQGKMPPVREHTSHDVGVLSSAAMSSSPNSIDGCPVFPADNIWNYDISNLPVDANSANYIASMGLTSSLRAYFGATVPGYAPPGIPYTTVPARQPYVPVSFYYQDQSDPGPYPIPNNAPIEGGQNSTGDRHVIVIDKATCELYEMFDAFPQPEDVSWYAGSGATWDLNSNHLRPLNWTSADAAGLPIFPALVRYDEVASGVIAHALRVTTTASQCTFLWPARHYASTNCDPNLPPMGLRLRLKASVDISSFPADDQVILKALKHYGMFVADNGPSSWVITGAPDQRFNNNDLALLGQITGSDFEAVDESALQLYPNSGKVNPDYLPLAHVQQVSNAQSKPLTILSNLPYPPLVMDLEYRRYQRM